VVALQQNLIAYDQFALTGAATLSRKLSTQWTVGIGLSLEKEKILQEGAHLFYTLVALPLTAKYDSTALSNPLNDPLHGMRLTVSLAPTESIGSPDATFVVFQATAAKYLDLARLGWTPAGRSVIAVRGLIAEAHGAGQFSLPPDQRFYAGGSATVRGYQFQSVGPLFTPLADPPIPKGGTDLDAASIEFRQRLWTNFGAAVFVDAGKVSIDPRPLQGRPSVGYGTGLRYYTPIGPIRFDVALPVRRLPDGAAFEIYVGLGQAF